MRHINVALGQKFSITADVNLFNVIIRVYEDHRIVGEAHLTTDQIDVGCVTSIYLDDTLVDKKFLDGFTLGEIFFKFIMKFPSIVRKPEFRFILDVPDNLKLIASKHHFDRGEDSSIQDEIMIRTSIILPEQREIPNGVYIKQSIEDDDLPKLLSLLKKSAYWQSHLTLDRLQILVKNSRCFVAFSSSDEIIGFSRVLTNNISFASLWDVVVDEAHRRKGIGMALMFSIFTDDTLSIIKNWVIFTDTAKSLYQKFGFVSESTVPDRKLVHKLRLQDSHPTYMTDLIQKVPKDQIIHLNIDSTFQFLFGIQGKRANLPTFWQKIPIINAKEKDEFQENSYRYTSMEPSPY